MLIKELEDRNINFIDSSDNFVGYDYSQCCCEQFGYAVLSDISDYNNKDVSDIDVSGEEWVFDTERDPKSVDLGDDYSDDGDAAIAFALKNKSTGDVAYLILYNYHNGYYAHGWDSSFAGSGAL